MVDGEGVACMDKEPLEAKGGNTPSSGIQGILIVVFTSLEDKYRVFEGGPYFYAAAGFYIWPWMMNFVPERKTFTLVPVWIRLYSLPLDYCYRNY